MLRYEWKKLLRNRKGIWQILFLLTFEVVGMLLFTQPHDKVLEAHRTVYESYLTQVEGSLTQEKRDFIEAEMERLNQIHQEIEQLKMDYYSGAVTEEIYRETFDRLLPEDEKYTGFSKLYSQYIFVRESENRSFLYTGGWEVLLTDQEPDYLLLLALIVLLTPVFCEEYACRMHEILLTQKKSARYQVLAKVAVSLLLAGILTAIIQLFDLAYCALRLGLPHGDFSLQSIQSFGSTAKELTLWQAFWLQFALKELGYLYAAVLILFLSVCLKKFALALMADIAVLPIPLLTVADHHGFLRIPGPWALTLGSIYLNGSIGSTDAVTGETVYILKELTMNELEIYVCTVGMIIVLMLLLIRHQNMNWHLKSFRRKAALALCAVMLTLTGCSGSESENTCYNVSTSSWCEMNDHIIIGSYDGSIMIDQQTNEAMTFPLDAMEGETVSIGSSLFAQGSSIYYLKSTTLNPAAGWDSITDFTVLAKLDTSTMDESVAYQWNQETSWFFGLLDRENMEPNPGMFNAFFIHGNDLYYIDGTGAGLCRMDLNGGRYETVLDHLESQDLAYDGTYLYYPDSYHRLVIRDLNTDAEQVIEEVVASRFLLTADGIFFVNRRDDDRLYYWNMSDRQVSRISDTSVSSVYWDEDYLWMTGKDDDMLYRINHDGSECTSAPLDGTICAIGSGRYLYLQNNLQDTVYAVDKESFDRIPIPVQ